MTNLYPLVLESQLHTKVWGGRNLAGVMNKILPTDEPYGESWELHDSAIVTNGEFAGRSVGDLIAEFGQTLIGDNDPAEGSPLLAKFLDANDWLSVQVHPNDAQAHELENDPRGKTEAWLILDAKPDAKLVIGLQSGTTPDAMAQAIQENRLEDQLVFANVKAGDVFFIPANTVHAIGPGIVLYEIQQNSNVTYRLYDWGRMGLDGNPRELHIDKGVKVSNLTTLPEVTHPKGDIMVQSDYFITYRHTLNNTSETVNTDGKFQSLTGVDGDVVVTWHNETYALPKGQTILIPAFIESFQLGGTGTCFRSCQP